MDRAAQCANFKIARDRLIGQHLQTKRGERPIGRDVIDGAFWEKEQLDLLRPQLDALEDPYEKRLGTTDAKVFCEKTEGTKFRSL